MVWENKNNEYEMNMLLSLRFNGKLYAPRHTNLPVKEFEFTPPVDPVAYANGRGCMGCEIKFTKGNWSGNSIARPVELFVVIDSNWCMTNPGAPLFTSFHSVGVEIELNLLKNFDGHFMKAINDKYFVMVTSFRLQVAGQTSNAWFPIIYLFKEGEADFYSVDTYSFTPRLENGNRIKDMQIKGKQVIFPMTNGKTVTLTFDPEPGCSIRWDSSDGATSMHCEGG
jgi:hypothetical protein